MVAAGIGEPLEAAALGARPRSRARGWGGNGGPSSPRSARAASRCCSPTTPWGPPRRCGRLEPHPPRGGRGSRGASGGARARRGAGRAGRARRGADADARARRPVRAARSPVGSADGRPLCRIDPPRGATLRQRSGRDSLPRPRTRSPARPAFRSCPRPARARARTASPPEVGERRAQSLELACSSFDELGSPGWAEAARSELTRVGGRKRGRRGSSRRPSGASRGWPPRASRTRRSHALSSSPCRRSRHTSRVRTQSSESARGRSSRPGFRSASRPKEPRFPRFRRATSRRTFDRVAQYLAELYVSRTTAPSRNGARAACGSPRRSSPVRGHLSAGCARSSSPRTRPASSCARPPPSMRCGRRPRRAALTFERIAEAIPPREPEEAQP